MSSDLETSLLEHVGGDLAPLRRAVEGVAPTPGTIARVIAIARLEERHCAENASWALKHLAAEGWRPSAAQGAELLALLDETEAPMAQLHLLQVLPDLAIPSSRAAALFDRLTALTTSANTFVRAWAFNGLAYLASLHDEYRNAAETRLGVALADEKPSVRARIRRAVEGDFGGGRPRSMRTRGRGGSGS